jgi:hypothetical protein
MGRGVHVTGLVVAGIFTVAAILISAWQIQQHIRYNNNAIMRKYCLRIILMVPIYAVNSWMGLYMPTHALYWDVLRECYEALVIYTFFNLLIISLGGEQQLARRLRYKDDHPHMFPFCCLPTCTCTYTSLPLYLTTALLGCQSTSFIFFSMS